MRLGAEESGRCGDWGLVVLRLAGVPKPTSANAGDWAKLKWGLELLATLSVVCARRGKELAGALRRDSSVLLLLNSSMCDRLRVGVLHGCI